VTRQPRTASAHPSLTLVPVKAIEVYSEGLFHVSVCVTQSASNGQIEAYVRKHYAVPRTPGAARWCLRWTVIPELSWIDGEPQGCPCDLVTGRKHYRLLAC